MLVDLLFHFSFISAHITYSNFMYENLCAMCKSIADEICETRTAMIKTAFPTSATNTLNALTLTQTHILMQSKQQEISSRFEAIIPLNWIYCEHKYLYNKRITIGPCKINEIQRYYSREHHSLLLFIRARRQITAKQHSYLVAFSQNHTIQSDVEHCNNLNIVPGLKIGMSSLFFLSYCISCCWIGCHPSKSVSFQLWNKAIKIACDCMGIRFHRNHVKSNISSIKHSPNIPLLSLFALIKMAFLYFSRKIEINPWKVFLRVFVLISSGRLFAMDSAPTGFDAFKIRELRQM